MTIVPGLLRRPRVVSAVMIVFVFVLCPLSVFVWFHIDRNPLKNLSLYVIPDTEAVQQLAIARSAGQPSAAAALKRLSSEPVAEWFTGGTAAEVESRAQFLAYRAAAAGKTLVGVVYNRPDRDCMDTGGDHTVSPDDYEAWLLGLVRGLTVPSYPEFRAILIYEPDGVAQTVGSTGCSTGAASTGRLAVEAEAVHTLTIQGNLVVYLDAGNSSWFSDPQVIVPALKQADAAEADGLAINVANFQTTDDSVRYGQALSAALGGKHFVIDTSRNGLGPYLGSKNEATDPSWCNPPDRAPGLTPSTDTGIANLDAYLWIKHWGESDGACRPGEPPAGDWMNAYALAGLSRS